MTGRRHALGLLAAVAAAIGTPAAAQESPAALPAEARINLSGTVVEASATSFELDYGDGTITVELDDIDELPEAAAIAAGDDVTVHGRIDGSVFEQRRIDARSVYVEALDTYFYAAAQDEGGLDDSVHRRDAAGRATLRGTVRGISPELDRFRLATGETVLAVDTNALDYDPFDDAGYQRIEPGDRVSVAGKVTREFFEGRVMEATSVVTLEGPPTN